MNNNPLQENLLQQNYIETNKMTFCQNNKKVFVKKRKQSA